MSLSITEIEVRENEREIEGEKVIQWNQLKEVKHVGKFSVATTLQKLDKKALDGHRVCKPYSIRDQQQKLGVVLELESNKQN